MISTLDFGTVIWTRFVNILFEKGRGLLLSIYIRSIDSLFNYRNCYFYMREEAGNNELLIMKSQVG